MPTSGILDNDPRGLWRRSDLTAAKPYDEGHYPVVGPHGDEFRPRSNRPWAISYNTFDELVTDNRIWWGKTGRSFPFRKRFASELGGLVPTTIWPNTETGNNREAKAEMRKLYGRDNAFATPKPERLLDRIIRVGSDPGDLVLDCFAGSGTTAAVAHKLERRWVTVELSPPNVETFVRPRMRGVVDGTDQGGVTDAADWTGGGGFSEAKVAPSMFEDVDGTVVLSDWVTNGQLAEAVAAQLKFVFEPDGPFVGRKGRTRLAVLDGMLTVGVADHLVDQLDERENLVVVAMTLEEGVAEHLRKQRPGSRARKVPRDLARSGKLAPRLVRLGHAEQQGEGR